MSVDDHGFGVGLAAAIVSLALSAVLTPFGPAAARTPDRPVAERALVRTLEGAVQGVEQDGVDVFTAIPYAAPPTGDRRFRPPQPRKPWAGRLDATGGSPACPQSEHSAIGIPSTDEDCLYLNVWTPAVRAGPALPVMVWIHGSGETGYGGSPYFSGIHLAHDQRVVFVTINYRLGALGSLVLPELDDPHAGFLSGDDWLLDQQAALGWVKRNIARFGGDPADVTVMGESAGGASVLSLLASPKSKGLFERAIVESEADGEPVGEAATDQGAPSFQWRSAPQLASRAVAERYGRQVVLPAVGCAGARDVAACLRAAPVSSFLGRGNAVVRVENPGLLPIDPFAAFRSGRFNHVPVLIGSNAEEGHFDVALLEAAIGRRLTAADYKADVNAHWPRSAALQALYPDTRFADPAAADSRLVTDLAFACPAELARAELSASTPVYGYEFTEPDPVQKEPLPAITELSNAPYHTSEEAYVFDSDQAYAPLTGRALALSTLIRGYWTAFARGGDPNGPGRPAWPRFSAKAPIVLDLREAPRPDPTFATDHNCPALSAAGLIGQGAP